MQMRITCTLNDIRRISIYSIIRVLCAVYLMTLCRYNLYRPGTCFNVIKIMTDNSTRHIFSCTFHEMRIKLTAVHFRPNRVSLSLENFLNFSTDKKEPFLIKALNSVETKANLGHKKLQDRNKIEV